MIDSGHCDGPETLMRLREIDNFNIPVIVLTVSKGKRDMFVNGYGFNEYMEKLLTQDKVMETLPKLFKDLEFTKIESNKYSIRPIAFFYLITYLLKKVYRQVLNYTKML